MKPLEWAFVSVLLAALGVIVYKLASGIMAQADFDRQCEERNGVVIERACVRLERITWEK